VGWNVIVVWECELKSNKKETCTRLIKNLQNNK
jgi:G:T-mismatch repair DNA endonuclease (very short patch repair protein)